MIKKYSPNLLRIIISTLCIFVLTGSSSFAEDISARVLARYPTQEQLQQRIDEAVKLNSIAYTLAMQDFGEAIRLSRSLSGPPWPGKKSPGVPHIKRGPVLSDLKTPAMWAISFRKADKIELGSEWVKFYRSHLDELTIDENSPLLQEALIDIVLNGWHDWSNWDHEKLVRLREKFPELHRVYALRELRRLKIKEIGSVLLELLIQPNLAQELFFPVREGVKELVNPNDAIEFFLDTYMQSNNPMIRTHMEHFIPPFSDRAGNGSRVKQIWRPHLESEIPLLRFEARKTFSLPVPDRFECNDLHERWVAENDADPGRREKARVHVKNRELRQRMRQRHKQQAP